MKQNSFKILFYIKKTRPLKNGEVPIFLRITVDGKREDLSISKSTPINKWDSKKGCCKGNGITERIINQHIDAIKLKLLKIHRDLEIDGELISARLVRSIFTGEHNPQKNLIEVFNNHNKKFRELVAVEERNGKTAQRYERTVRYLKEYMKIEYNMEDILLNKITPSFLTDFEHFLKTKKKCGHNMCKKYLKCIRTIIINAIANNWMKADPYTEVDMVEVPTTPVFLSYAELEKIINKEFSTERLDNVRDIFVFSCLTGMSFADVKTLEKEHIFNEINSIIVRKKRVKTKVDFRVPLSELPLLLIEKYENHDKCIMSGRIFPVLSNQKMNEYLKEIADICGISKVLTTHIARHTKSSNYMYFSVLQS